ncbi:MAG: FadR/GntR family transcriptional regulator [Thermomicrobiales bacterium]
MVTLVQLEPVAKQSLSQAVMQSLVTFIKTGPLQPGDALPNQHELARQLGVSRPVLREAMQVLAARGVLTIKPGSGCYISSALDAPAETVLESLIHESALEALEARMVIEVELAGLAAERGNPDDFDVIETILKRLERAVAQREDTAVITSDFHRELARAGHNAILFRMSELLSRSRTDQGLRIEHALPDVRAGELESHRKLFQAVRGGRPEIARAAMREHLERAHGWEEQVAALRDAAQRAGSLLAAP